MGMDLTNKEILKQIKARVALAFIYPILSLLANKAVISTKLTLPNALWYNLLLSSLKVMYMESCLYKGAVPPTGISGGVSHIA